MINPLDYDNQDDEAEEECRILLKKPTE